VDAEVASSYIVRGARAALDQPKERRKPMLFAAVIVSVRRRRRTPRRPAYGPPLWRLLAGELVEGVGWIFRGLVRKGRRRRCESVPHAMRATEISCSSNCGTPAAA
jgi:hypothetical protein